MKLSKTTTLALLFGTIPTISFANTETTNHNYNEYDYKEPAEYVYEYDYKKPVRFFIGLNAPLIQYQNIKASANSYEETDSVTKINNKIFENTALVFGADTDSDFRLSFLISHNSNETKIANISTKTKQTNLGLVLDIPFLKEAETKPFARLGLEYLNFEQTDIDMSGSGIGYILGLGITHNFTNDIFGVISASYAFGKPDVDVSDVELSYKENTFGLSVGLGYRF